MLLSTSIPCCLTEPSEDIRMSNYQSFSGLDWFLTYM